MKAVFMALLPDSESMMNRVYTPETVEYLRERAHLLGYVVHEADLERLRGEPSQAEILFSTWGMPPLSAAECRSLFPSLKAVFFAAGTVQHFARPLLENGVRIFSAADGNAIPVAEMAAAQILLANKGFFATSRLYKAGLYEQAKKAGAQYAGNYGSKVGIIGAGKIGSRVILQLQAHQLDILVFDPFLPAETAAQWGAELCSLGELFSRCDVISNHLANNAQTKGLLDAACFSAMKPYATFINTARGAQVVEADLVQALREVPTRSAILDVTDPEPVREGHPFYALPNVVLTPHITGSSANEVARLGWMMAQEFDAYLRGQPLSYEVTLEMLDHMA